MLNTSVIKRVMLLLAFSMVLAGCGQKGPLVQPDKAAATPLLTQHV